MPTDRKTPTPGLRDRILAAKSVEDIERLTAQAATFENMSDKSLRLINRAAVKRRKELCRP